MTWTPNESWRQHPQNPQSAYQTGIVAHISVPRSQIIDIAVDVFQTMTTVLNLAPSEYAHLARWRNTRDRSTTIKNITSIKVKEFCTNDRFMGILTVHRHNIAVGTVASDVQELGTSEQDILRIQATWTGTKEDAREQCMRYAQIANELLRFGEVLSVLVDADVSFDWQAARLYPLTRDRWTVEQCSELVPGYGWLTYVGERLGLDLMPVGAEMVTDAAGHRVARTQLGPDPMDDATIRDRLPLLRAHMRPALAGWVLWEERSRGRIRSLEGPVTDRSVSSFALNVFEGERPHVLTVLDWVAENGVTIGPAVLEPGRVEWVGRLDPSADPGFVEAMIRGSCSAVERGLSDGWISGSTFDWEPPTFDGVNVRWSTDVGECEGPLIEFCAAVCISIGLLQAPGLQGLDGR